MATKLITFVGGHEQWDGQIAEVATTSHGTAERWVKSEDITLVYVDSGEVEEIPITEGAVGRERTRMKKVSLYRFDHVKSEGDVDDGGGQSDGDVLFSV